MRGWQVKRKTRIIHGEWIRTKYDRHRCAHASACNQIHDLFPNATQQNKSDEAEIDDDDDVRTWIFIFIFFIFFSLIRYFS